MEEEDFHLELQQLGTTDQHALRSVVTWAKGLALMHVEQGGVEGDIDNMTGICIA